MKTLDDFGLTGSLVALVTPMDDRGSIDLDAWDRLLDWHAESGTRGVVVGGTTGESATLSAEERNELLERALGRIGDRCRVVAGTGAASTAAAVEQSVRAARCGAHAVLVVTPYYNRPPQRGLVAHYRAVADACEAPVILYNVPGRTAVDLDPRTTIELCRHDRIIGIKEAVSDMQRVRRLADAGIGVLSGDDPTAREAIRNGARGVISVAANVAPGRFAAMCEAALAGTRLPMPPMPNWLRCIRFSARRPTRYPPSGCSARWAGSAPVSGFRWCRWTGRTTRPVERWSARCPTDENSTGERRFPPRHPYSASWPCCR